MKTALTSLAARSWRWLAATAVYFAVARAGMAFSSLHGGISPVWPATAVAVGLVMRLGPWAGISIVVGHVLASRWSGVPIVTEVMMSSGVVIEALLGAALWRQIHSRGPKLLKEYVTLAATLVVATGPTLLAASLGTTGAWLGGLIPATEFSRAWTTWWIGDSLGALFVLPVLASGPGLLRWLRELSPSAATRASIAALALAAVCAATFFSPGPALMVIGILPLFLIVALLLPRPVTSVFCCGVAVVAIIGTFQGDGPFSTSVLNWDLVNLQLFLSTLAIAAQVLPHFRAPRPTVTMAVLLAGWLASGGAFYVLRAKQIRSDQADLNTLFRNATAGIEHRFEQTIAVMRASAATFGTWPNLAPAEWSAYVESLALPLNRPGLQALSVVQPTDVIPVPTLDHTSALLRRPRFIVTHPGPDGFCVLPEGFDLASVEIYRTKADTARLRQQVQFAVDFNGFISNAEGKLPPVLLYPVVAESAATQADRGPSRFLGWICGTLDLNTLLGDVLGRRQGLVTFSLFSPGALDSAHLLYRSSSAGSPGPFVVTRELVVAGQSFTLAWRAGPDFRHSDNSSAVWTFLGLAFGTLLLAAFVHNLQSFRERAEKLARERTRDLEAEIIRREATQQTLRHVTGFQCAILESADLAIISTDRAGVIQTFNPAAERMLGYAAGEAIGQFTPERFHDPAEVAERARQLGLTSGSSVNAGFDTLRAVVRADPTGGGEWNFIRKDGQRLPVHLTMTPMHDAAGAHIGFVTLVTDISRSREQAAALERERQLLRTLVENLPSAVFATDAAGRYVLANPAQALSLGMTLPSDLIGRTIADFMPANVAAAIAASDREILRTGVGKYHEEEYYERGGKGGYYSVTKIPLRDATQAITAIIGIKHDITAHKAHETALIKAQRSAEDASRAKSEFLATMSHEIRTPMNAVIGFTELLGDTPLQERQREYVEIIQSSGQYLITLINDILDFSKIEAGKMEIEHVRFDGIAVMQATVQTLRPGALKKALALEFAPSDNLPRVLVGDAARFRQVLLNLLGNALKFTARGLVAVHATAIPADGPQALRITVTDTGVGIPREKQPLLFEKFTQADSSVTREFGGSGLGLAICKRLVEMMGGSIGFHSELGQGSTFWFEIPLATDQSAPAPAGFSMPPIPALAPVKDIPPASNRRRVLVADDNEVNQQLVCSYLHKLGCDSVVVPNGAEALQAVKSGEFDLVLMDHQMPVMDGCEATTQIREWENISRRPLRLPIIALTANVGHRGSSLYQAAGMDFHLTKPLVLSALEQALEKVWGARTRPAEPPASAQPEGENFAAVISPSPLRLVDPARALERLDGNPELLAQLAKAFSAQSSQLVVELAAAVARTDRAQLQALAHKVKGSVGTFVAEIVGEAARQIERTAGQADWTTLASETDQLVALIGQLREELDALTVSYLR